MNVRCNRCGLLLTQNLEEQWVGPNESRFCFKTSAASSVQTDKVHRRSIMAFHYPRPKDLLDDLRGLEEGLR
jgi:hypothetical protein